MSIKAADLDGMTVQELTALIVAAEAKRQEKQGKAKAALLAEFREKAAQLGLSFDQVISAAPDHSGKKSRKGAGAGIAAKFRGPNGEEWSGRGRLPKWLQAMEAEGRKRDEFAVR